VYTHNSFGAKYLSLHRILMTLGHIAYFVIDFYVILVEFR
jgi:hypothetical protein